MKTAIIHDWIMSMRGGEKCLEVFCELFPKATIFTLVHKKGIASPLIENMDIRTSFIQKLPKAEAWYRNYLPLFPKAIESFDLRGYDFILSSSHCVAKGVKVPKGARHICYCYTPMRYIWFFFDEYFGRENIIKRKFISAVAKRLKEWDLRTNKNIDYFIAISDNVKDRIKKIYNENAEVIYPPADVDSFSASHKDNNFYLIVSALVPYKRIDLAIEAFNETGKKLVIIGAGNVEKALKDMANSNIEFMGCVDSDKLRQFYYNCTAVVFPGEEDFGIVPVETQACGKPVIAYGKGGVLESVAGFDSAVLNPTGIFFYEQTPSALIEAIKIFEKNKDRFVPEKIRQNSLRFSRDIFKQKIKQYINDKLW